MQTEKNLNGVYKNWDLIFLLKGRQLSVIVRKYIHLTKKVIKCVQHTKRFFFFEFCKINIFSLLLVSTKN